MLEDRYHQHDQQVVDKYQDPNDDYYMTTRDYVVRPYADNDSGPITIYLPPVSEAKGRFYSIIVRDADSTNTVTITHLGDSECWGGPYVLESACDGLLLYSDGLAWFPIYSRIPIP